MTGLLLNCIICTIMVLGILMVLYDSRENFVDSGIYPKSVTQPILTNSYPLKTPGGLSSWNYSSQWKLFPIWSVGSYKQKTNDVLKVNVFAFFSLCAGTFFVCCRRNAYN